MAAAVLLLTSCAPAADGEEQAASDALTAYLADNPSAGVTIDDREGPWKHEDGYAFLLSGDYTSQNGTSESSETTYQVYFVSEGADGWDVSQEASFGAPGGKWTVILFGGDRVDVDLQKSPHRATCYVLEADKEGDPDSCDAITD
ncbi:MAG: hypothetical protein JF592_18450 [Microbacterium sp.]|uniref:hypothetical protein n=1 Tax=Microbacterium sp. TaxID=51671 RepID=UPI001D9C75A0|nr:hypothetical protein [Microbacterium sp.]MBW8764530.1 hypothetical protein [Microbacterium sp.]